MAPTADLATLDTRPVGQTPLRLTSLSLGCASIGNLGHAVTDQQAGDVLDHAWNAGIRYFDTAPHYGRGRSEQRLGQFLARRDRSSYVVSTKVGRVLRPGAQLPQADGFIDPLPSAVHYDYSAAGFEESLDGSLRRLGCGRVDIVYVHDIGTVTHGEANERHFDDLMSTGLPYLERLRAAGTIGAIGLGVNESAVCVRVLTQQRLDVILLAGRWTLLDREAEEQLVPLCRERGTSLVLGGIFNSGILATGAAAGAMFNYAAADEVTLEKVRHLAKLCAEQGVDLPHAALQFGLTRPGVASVLLGTSSTTRLTQNLSMAATPLSPVASGRLFT